MLHRDKINTVEIKVTAKKMCDNEDWLPDFEIIWWDNLIECGLIRIQIGG